MRAAAPSSPDRRTPGSPALPTSQRTDSGPSTRHSRFNGGSQQRITYTKGLTTMTNDEFECHTEADRHAALLWATKAAVAAFVDDRQPPYDD